MHTDPAQEPRTGTRSLAAYHRCGDRNDLAEQGSWETVEVTCGGRTPGVSLDDVRGVFREKEDVVDAFFDRADEAMLRAAEAPGFLDMPTRVRLHRVIDGLARGARPPPAGDSPDHHG